MTESGFGSEASYSVFEVLRPGPGVTLDRLAIATYSLDLLAVAALILSLSPAGEQELDAGPLSFLDALGRLAPRIDVVYQKGRLYPAENVHRILHVFDQRIHAVEPIRGASYHPKLALARYVDGRDAITWRLWIGSRNLAGGQHREAGLLLTGKVSGQGSLLPKVADMARDLLQPVAWIEGHLAELATVRWKAPEGVKVRDLHWRRAGDIKLFPTTWVGADSILAISPFVDDWGRRLLDYTPGQALVTTNAAANGLLSTGKTDVYAADDSPICEPMNADASPEGPMGETPSPINARQALHAKLLLSRRGERARLWIGSANLTKRGMQGPNAEVLAELEVPVAVSDDLEAFKAFHSLFQPQPTDPQVEAETRAARELDEASIAVLEASFELRKDAEGLRLMVEPSLDRFLIDHRLSASLLTRPDAVTEWQPGESCILLVAGGVPLKLETSLVAFTAERRAGGCAPRRWAQSVAFPGHKPEARDVAATASYIQLSSAGAWLRSQLGGIAPYEPITWTGSPRWAGSEHAGSVDPLPLALEEILGAWARNPAEFERRVVDITSTVRALGEELNRSDDAEGASSAAEWTKVEAFWRQVRKAIPERDNA
jgi:hypothetical protein